jgi:hypothetical protein
MILTSPPNGDAFDDRSGLAEHGGARVLADETALARDLVDERLPAARAGQDRGVVHARHQHGRQHPIRADRVGRSIMCASRLEQRGVWAMSRNVRRDAMAATATPTICRADERR